MSNAPTLLQPTEFACQLAQIAQSEYEQFKELHHSNPALRHHIRQYWLYLHMAFPGTEQPWDAVFVSYCVKKAGATLDEFRFGATHASFVARAIQAAEHNDAPFQGFAAYARPVETGDILVQRNPGTHVSFEEAKSNPHLQVHSAIVVDVQEDSESKYAVAVRGDVAGSISRFKVPLEPDGHLKWQDSQDYVCVIKNLK